MHHCLVSDAFRLQEIVPSPGRERLHDWDNTHTTKTTRAKKAVRKKGPENGPPLQWKLIGWARFVARFPGTFFGLVFWHTRKF